MNEPRSLSRKPNTATAPEVASVAAPLTAMLSKHTPAASRQSREPLRLVNSVSTSNDSTARVPPSTPTPSSFSPSFYSERNENEAPYYPSAGETDGELLSAVIDAKGATKSVSTLAVSPGDFHVNENYQYKPGDMEQGGLFRAAKLPDHFQSEVKPPSLSVETVAQRPLRWKCFVVFGTITCLCLLVCLGLQFFADLPAIPWGRSPSDEINNGLSVNATKPASPLLDDTQSSTGILKDGPVMEKASTALIVWSQTFLGYQPCKPRNHSISAKNASTAVKLLLPSKQFAQRDWAQYTGHTNHRKLFDRSANKVKDETKAVAKLLPIPKVATKSWVWRFVPFMLVFAFVVIALFYSIWHCLTHKKEARAVGPTDYLTSVEFVATVSDRVAIDSMQQDAFWNWHNNDNENSTLALGPVDEGTTQCLIDLNNPNDDEGTTGVSFGEDQDTLADEGALDSIDSSNSYYDAMAEDHTAFDSMDLNGVDDGTTESPLLDTFHDLGGTSNDLEWPTEPPEVSADWYAVFIRLVEYKEAHGNCHVPGFYRPDESLGRWVCTQRKYLSVEEGTILTKEQHQRIAMLNAVGFEWNGTVAAAARRCRRGRPSHSTPRHRQSAHPQQIAQLHGQQEASFYMQESALRLQALRLQSEQSQEQYYQSVLSHEQTTAFGQNLDTNRAYHGVMNQVAGIPQNGQIGHTPGLSYEQERALFFQQWQPQLQRPHFPSINQVAGIPQVGQMGRMPGLSYEEECARFVQPWLQQSQQQPHFQSMSLMPPQSNAFGWNVGNNLIPDVAVRRSHQEQREQFFRDFDYQPL